MGVIQAMRSYGQYLLVFMGGQTWVLSGESEESWTIRHLGSKGCIGPQAHTVHDGLVYFLGNSGLHVTDGTTIEPAPGMERWREWLMARIDSIQNDLQADDELKGQRPSLFNWQGYIWITLSTPTGGTDGDNLTAVYDPRTGSLWKTNLPVLDVAKYSRNSAAHLVFCAPTTYTDRPFIFEYGKSDDGDEDDTGLDVYASTPVTWNVRFTWWPFGLLREQRRIRRVWALVKGACTFTLSAYRDWVESEVQSTATVVASTTPVHIEGETFQDSHAVSFKLAGTERPAAVYGVAVDSQFRRQRYHS